MTDMITILDARQIIFLLGLASAALGLFVASLAYRGYVRNESTPMLYLTIGVVFLTTIRFLVSYGVDRLLAVTAPVVVLLVTASHLLGLTAIVQSLRTT